jgi:drug/metabolite transporter (DMT)-like permease
LLDGLAWALMLVAVQALPLFVVQPIVALSIIITILVERFAFKRLLSTKVIGAMCLIVVGLILLTFTATTESATPVSHPIQLVIILSPLLLAAVGGVYIRKESQSSTFLLAAISGLAFGGTAITGRMMTFSPPYWQVIFSPLFIALLVYGLVGIMFFTAALQRHQASVVNAIMMAFETIIPMVVGLLFLGDTPSHNSWFLMVLGAGLALAGTFLVTVGSPNQTVALQLISKSD